MEYGQGGPPRIDMNMRRGEIADLSVAGMSLFFMSEVSKPHILKWRADDAIAFRHITAS